MAHGTWDVLPFNWSPNSGQFVDEVSRGPLDAILILEDIPVCVLAEFLLVFEQVPCCWMVLA